MYYAEGLLDKKIRELFFPDFEYKGVMVEVGAGPAVFISMSKHFRETGWRCISVDPNPKFVEQHKKLGHEIYPFACSDEIKKGQFKIVQAPNTHIEANDGCSWSAIDTRYAYPADAKVETIEVDIITLDTLLDSIDVEKIDYLSIDTEGWEIDVMKGFDHIKYEPKVIVLENVQDEPKYPSYMNSIGYKLELKEGYNEIYTKF